MFKLHFDVFSIYFCNGALKLIVNSRNMKKIQLQNVWGYEIYIQNQI